MRATKKAIIFMIILWVLLMMINGNYDIVKNAIFDTWNAVMPSIILISGIILMAKTIFK